MQFSVTMCVALCLSAINSLTLSPALCVLLLKKKKKKQSRFSPFRPFNATLEWARKSYIKCAGIMVRRAWLTLILLAAVLVGNWKLFETVPKSFLPRKTRAPSSATSSWRRAPLWAARNRPCAARNRSS